MIRLTIIVFVLISLIGCSNTEQTVGDLFDDFDEDYLEETMPGNLTLENLRTRLSDSYSTKTNDIPEIFTKERTETEVVFDPYEGYRIQIYSGQSVEQADTLASRFRAWSDSTLINYQPETYTFFRTPHYRVHVGDFHDREKAITFSNLVKRYFSGAWVVHDQVEPSKVQADTLQVELD